jgi:hypothetical protein
MQHPQQIELVSLKQIINCKETIGESARIIPAGAVISISSMGGGEK